MEIVVVSDSHGKNKYLDKIVGLYPNADLFLHCGDIGFSKEMYSIFKTVEGNNDELNHYPLTQLIEINNHKLLLTHGHQYNSSNRIKELVKLAKSVGADIVCYGHTHLAKVTRIENVILINPGALWRCLGKRGASYALIKLRDNKIEAEIKYFDEK